MDDGIHVKAIIRILWLEYDFLIGDLLSFFFLFFLSFFHLQFCLEKLYYRLGGQRKLDALVLKNYSKSREFYSSHAPHAAGLSYYLFFPCFIVLTFL